MSQRTPAPRRIFAPLRPLPSPWDALAAECPDGLTARQHERLVNGAGVCHVVAPDGKVRCESAVVRAWTRWPAGGLAEGWRISAAQKAAEQEGRAK